VPGIASIMGFVMSVNRTVVFETNASTGRYPGRKTTPACSRSHLQASFELGVTEAAWTRTAQTHLPLFMSPALPRQEPFNVSGQENCYILYPPELRRFAVLQLQYSLGRAGR
jgi:hypothetical protein